MIAYVIYLMFMVSWFLHMPSRIPALGAMKMDFVLFFVLVLLKLVLPRAKPSGTEADTDIVRRHVVLFLVIIATTPLAMFPGSVLRFGIPNYIKAIVFLYFTVWFVDSSAKLRWFLAVFLGCQIFRIMEPLYLNATKGYWGSKASISGWEYINRLSGAPSDVINPNGLAYVILIVLAFMLAFYRVSMLSRIVALIVVPLSLYALVLTSSRSGFLALIFLAGVHFYKPAMRSYFLVAIVLGAVLVLPGYLGDQYKDRYSSIFSSDTRNAKTAEGRITGLIEDTKVGLKRPFFGFGLGTSLEANANFGQGPKPSHNIFVETFQEIGIVGLSFFLLFLKSIFVGIRRFNGDDQPQFNRCLKKGLTTFAAMTLFFGFASYGLSSYEWYLIGGLTIALGAIAEREKEVVVAERVEEVAIA